MCVSFLLQQNTFCLLYFQLCILSKWNKAVRSKLINSESVRSISSRLCPSGPILRIIPTIPRYSSSWTTRGIWPYTNGKSSQNPSQQIKRYHNGQSSCNKTVRAQCRQRNDPSIMMMEISRILAIAQWQRSPVLNVNYSNTPRSVCLLHFPPKCLFVHCPIQIVCSPICVSSDSNQNRSGWVWISFLWQFGWAVDGFLAFLYMARSRGQIPVDVHEDIGDERTRGLALWSSLYRFVLSSICVQNT